MEGKREACEMTKHDNPFHEIYETFIKECKIVVTQAGNGYKLSFGHSILMDNIVVAVEPQVIEPSSNTCRELVICRDDEKKNEKKVVRFEEKNGKEMKQHDLPKPAPVRFVFSDFGLVCPTCDIVRCDSCGKFHLTLRCPARGRRCEMCGKLDHFKYRCGFKKVVTELV